LAANRDRRDERGRPGARTLLLLTDRSQVEILRALDRQPTGAAELGEAIGLAPGSAPRAQLRRLARLRAIDERRLNAFPGLLEYELGAAGRELLELDRVLERWLGELPHGPLRPGSDAATSAVRALAESWSAGVVSGLAEGLLRLGELDRELNSAGYPLLERRLAALRRARLTHRCEANRRDGRNTAGYALRRAVPALLAAAHWEERHDPEGAPLPRADREALELLRGPPGLPER